MKRKILAVMTVLCLLVALMCSVACNRVKDANYYAKKLERLGYTEVEIMNEEDLGGGAEWVVLGLHEQSDSLIVISQAKTSSDAYYIERDIKQYFEDGGYSVEDCKTFRKENTIFFGDNLLPIIS